MYLSPYSACKRGSEVFRPPTDAQVELRNWNRPYAEEFGFWAFGFHDDSCATSCWSASHCAPSQPYLALAIAATIFWSSPFGAEPPPPPRNSPMSPAISLILPTKPSMNFFGSAATALTHGLSPSFS